MFLNIITPCSRPENLQTISESINIPKENYRWIVVFDSDKIPTEYNLPKNAEYYNVKVNESVVGHGQRNFALDLIKEGYVYFNDDDTIIHRELWQNIKDTDADFISFKQGEKYGDLRLEGAEIEIGKIDSHNFIVENNIIKETRFIIYQYAADGFFAKECYNKSKNHFYIPKILSIYNSLR